MPQFETDDPGIAILVARANAFSAYSSFENSLCESFAKLTGMDRDVAGLIFYKINNYRTRDTIIEKLIRRRFNKVYNASWSSIFRLSKQLSDRRNELAHWQERASVSIEDGILNIDVADDVVLVPPNMWWQSENTPTRSINDIFETANALDYLGRTIGMFNLLLMDGLLISEHVISGRLDAVNTWHKRFLEPIPYPPPEDHPLHMNPSVWRNPRLPSPE